VRKKKGKKWVKSASVGDKEKKPERTLALRADRGTRALDEGSQTGTREGGTLKFHLQEKKKQINQKNRKAMLLRWAHACPAHSGWRRTEAFDRHVEVKKGIFMGDWFRRGHVELFTGRSKGGKVLGGTVPNLARNSSRAVRQGDLHLGGEDPNVLCSLGGWVTKTRKKEKSEREQRKPTALKTTLNAHGATRVKKGA